MQCNALHDCSWIGPLVKLAGVGRQNGLGHAGGQRQSSRTLRIEQASNCLMCIFRREEVADWVHLKNSVKVS